MGRGQRVTWKLCPAAAQEANNTRHCIIRLSAVSAAAIIIIAESDNLCEQRQRLTATEEEVTWRRGGFGKLPLSTLPPPRALSRESEKMGITRIKEGKRQ